MKQAALPVAYDRQRILKVDKNLTAVVALEEERPNQTARRRTGGSRTPKRLNSAQSGRAWRVSQAQGQWASWDEDGRTGSVPEYWGKWLWAGCGTSGGRIWWGLTGLLI